MANTGRVCVYRINVYGIKYQVALYLRLVAQDSLILIASFLAITAAVRIVVSGNGDLRILSNGGTIVTNPESLPVYTRRSWAKAYPYRQVGWSTYTWWSTTWPT